MEKIFKLKVSQCISRSIVRDYNYLTNKFPAQVPFYFDADADPTQFSKFPDF